MVLNLGYIAALHSGRCFLIQRNKKCERLNGEKKAFEVLLQVREISFEDLIRQQYPLQLLKCLYLLTNRIFMRQRSTAVDHS